MHFAVQIHSFDKQHQGIKSIAWVSWDMGGRVRQADRQTATLDKRHRGKGSTECSWKYLSK